MVGYKAVDKDMRGMNNYQYELGKLHIHDGKLVMCESGFHFCKYPSGVWAYFNEPETRIFKVEAYDVHPKCDGNGAIIKYVAKKIKLIEEIEIDGEGNTIDKNTGNYNTGDCNTGDCNTGHWNTGDCNTGDCNTGHWNTGHRNTGHRNTGNSNTGDLNTGNSNTGNYNTGDNNTGHKNTGSRNTGSRNTGDWNTGIGNATNRSAGSFCVKEPKHISFDVQTDLTYEQYIEKFPKASELSYALLKDDPIDFDKYKNIPGITKKKLEILHNKFKKARKK